ncbi:helix-turn-helix domain-containing protein [Stutzerimonas chloritidismutans]|uniref:helix-turn-helix domain-containing protein n=1 Tax=Stutzerimonas chloritidismutans TaxID=203192 RepID=UPI0028A6EDEC|nr:helix-turn-helix domain-containing protein [Stutzerimonas chloritidismutans]
MEAKVIFRDEKLIDIVLTINLTSLEAAVAATKENIEGKNRRGRPFSLNARQILEVLDALAEGTTQKEIAERYGVSQATISHYANKKFNNEVTP